MVSSLKDDDTTSRAVCGNRISMLKIKIGYKKGGRHLLAKLTAKEVRTIRRRAGKGETHSLIAAHFAVSREAISCIARRETWAHLR